MRRSRSSTSIPMPLNKANRESRAKSVQRMSKEITTPLIQRQLSVGPYMQTPLNSAIRRIRSSSSSSIGSRVSGSTSRKSPASTQKLVNDKKWVTEQYLMICNYIRNSDAFRPEIADMIRPPTINVFIQLVTTLFSTLIKTGPINNQSYAEVVLNHLKILKYPENLTMSTMKTVNTMHAWPHFISIISFLINKNKINDARPVHWKNKEIRTPLDAFWKVLSIKYENFNGVQTGISDEMAHEELYKEMSILYGIDRNALEEKKNKKAKYEAEVAELDRQLEEVMAEVSKIEEETARKREIMEDFKENNANKHLKLDKEINNLKDSVVAAKERVKEMISITKALEKTIANQTCSRKQKTELLNEIEQIERIIHRKETKIDNYKKVKDTLDYELVNVIKEVEQKVDAWNMQVTKSLLPEINVLSLREKGFHTDFLEELKVTAVKSKSTEEQLLKELDKYLLQMDEWNKKEELLNKRKKVLWSMEDDVAELKLDTEDLKNQTIEIITKIEEIQKSSYTSSMESLEAQIKQEEAEIQDVKERVNTVAGQIENESKMGLAVCVEARSRVLEAILKMDEMLHKELHDITEIAKHREQEVLNLIEEIKCLEATFSSYM